jgi:hypothetical protein
MARPLDTHAHTHAHAPINLHDVLNSSTVDDVKKLIALLPIKIKPTRKAELVAAVEGYMHGDHLLDLWQQLDHLQQLAIAETLYSSNGFFDGARFQAKYGRLPIFGTKNSRSYAEIPSSLRLFIHKSPNYRACEWLIPADLRQRLQAFVNKPDTFILPSEASLPEPSETPLTQREAEREALLDLPLLMRLMDKGKIAVSNKTFQPSLATMKALIGQLSNGDFYELTPKQHQWEQEIGPIKAFAWPLLLQAGKLVELRGNKLALTKAGRVALSKPSPETLRLIWQRWLKTKLLDEFSRISAIKGQGGKGKRLMTAATDRRAVVAEALAECPVGRWVSIDDLWRFMQAADFSFEVTRDPWHLYIVDAQYGSLGYQDGHSWSLLQGRYTLCVLFEYAATLGIIDVAYTAPEHSREDYADNWGVDELSFLSRYDGLQSIKLTSLGAYCLGLIETYTPSRVFTRTAFSVLPSLQVKVSNGGLLAEEALFLENYAEAQSETLWRLDRHKSLIAVENGHDITELQEFLRAGDDQLLPETVEGFMTTIQRQGQALRHRGTVLLIECADAKLADLIATNAQTQALCQRTGERGLVIASDSENAFRKAIHQLGYGLPKA